MINTEIYSTMTVNDWLERELAIAAEGKAKIIASIVAEPDPNDTVELARKLESTGLVHMFELNVSCPMPDAQVGYRTGQDTEVVFNQTRAVKEVSNLPVGIKMTPNVSDMVPIAQAAKEAGADFLAVSNSVRSFAGVNIETGQPYLPAYGGYTGPAIKPIIQRFVSEVARAVDIPISAVGGVRTWEDAVEYIMLGATTVQTVTAVMWDGYGALKKLINGLQRFMERKGYNSIEDFRGIALPYIKTIDEYASQPRKWAALKREKCSPCGLCFRVCFYDALYPDSQDYPEIRRENCDGCGLCIQVCPRQALFLD
jgi:dihydropyrimidine dehydrogenase (NAD+) subunit PreA